MPHLLVRHRVEDYARWRPVFDDHASFREQHGSNGGQVFRSADDPNEVVMLFEVDDLDRMREFVGSDELREAMQSAGVVDQPDVYFLNEDDPNCQVKGAREACRRMRPAASSAAREERTGSGPTGRVPHRLRRTSEHEAGGGRSCAVRPSLRRA